MGTTADIRNGLVIRHNGELVQIDSFQHVKPGKGGAFIRTKLRRISDGSPLENTFRSGHSIDIVRLNTKKMSYIYSEENALYLMDMDTFEQVPIPAAMLGERLPYLKEEMELTIQFDEENTPVTVELPSVVALEVVETGPNDKGDTASGGSKPAILENEVKARVPFFIAVGNVVKIDTRTGDYLGRA